MNPDRLHLSWDKWDNEREIVRITDALEVRFPHVRFCIRITLARHSPGQDRAEISLYTEGGQEDRKICTIHHILGSYLMIENIITAVRTALKKDT